MPKRKYADIEALVREKGISPNQAARQLGYTSEFQFRVNEADGAVKRRYRATDAKRNESSKKQTVGVPDFYENPISNTQKHHLRMLSLFDPLFEGLSDSNAKELAQHAVEIGVPLGDVLANRGDLPQPEHSELHKYQRKHGLTGQHIPSFKDATLADRKKALEVFYKDFIQPDIDAKTMSLMQEYQSKNPKQYAQTYASQLDQVAQQTARPNLTPNSQPANNTTLAKLQQVAQQVAHRTGTKLLRNAVPGAGTTLDWADTKQRYDEFVQEPNLINGAQLITQGLSSISNSVGDAALATGIGAPIALGAEKLSGAMTVTDAALEGIEGLSNKPQ